MENITKALHARVDTARSNPAATPLFQNSAFESDSDFFYSRKNNPNVQEFEDAVKCLEDAQYAIATSSGMAAIMLVLGLLRPGQVVVINKFIYGCSFKLFQWYCTQYNLQLIVADLTQSENFDKLPDADLVFFETPTNPFLLSVEITRVSDAFKARRPETMIVVDNTWATPLYQSPCALGADISLHSATKYLSGHSDVMGGVLLTDNQNVAQDLRVLRFYTGPVLDPHSAWLLRRSLQTLEIRLERHASTTKKIVDFLRSRKEIKRLYYPKVDGSQLRGYATLIFVQLDEATTLRYDELCRKLTHFSTGTGMACVTSMIAQPFSGSHASMNDDEKKEMGLDKSLIRLSFGMESPADLITDLKNAFESM